jgi:uncharacterized protein YjiS (DUF1127 family)
MLPAGSFIKHRNDGDPGHHEIAARLLEETIMERALSTTHGSHRGGLHPLDRLVSLMSLGRSRRRLGELDEHLLRDIGLTSTEARREAEKPVWNAPEHWLR